MNYLCTTNTSFQMAKRILIVDDEPDICEILRFNLEMEGYDITTAEAPFAIEGALPDLILLDVMMTPISGFEWARQLKSNARTADIPIIFCTAKATEDDTLTGFALGSDDYICKPFRISEVKARVRAVLRRTCKTESEAESKAQAMLGNLIHYKGITMDLDTKMCKVDGEEVNFTKLEFELFALLASKPGQLFSRQKILSSVWPNDTVVLDRTVDVNITRIRKKIGRYGECLKTRVGYGYILEL